MNNDFKTIAENYHKDFGFDLLPIDFNKEPVKINRYKRFEWKHLQKNSQTISQIQKINWNTDTRGIAAVIKNDLLFLDFDHCNDIGFVKKILEEIDVSFSWLYKTGNGFQFSCRCPRKEAFGGAGVNKYKPAEEYFKLIKHIEVRKYGCYSTLPHSQHANGTVYQFIEGYPKTKPEVVEPEKIISVLKKYFDFTKPIIETNSQKLNDVFRKGVSETERHSYLLKLSKKWIAQGIDKSQFIVLAKDFNSRCEPPEEEKEIDRQINDLWKRYARNNGVFYYIEECLLGMDKPFDELLKTIVTYSVIEREPESDFIIRFGLQDKATGYYLECQKYIKDYEDKFGRSSNINRIGEGIIIDYLEKKNGWNENLFRTYWGIISFLGKKLTQPISWSIIMARGQGHTNREELELAGKKAKLSEYILREITVPELKIRNLIRVNRLKDKYMYDFTTRTQELTDEKHLEIITQKKLRKLDKEKRELELREPFLKQITDKENELKAMKKKIRAY